MLNSKIPSILFFPLKLNEEDMPMINDF